MRQSVSLVMVVLALAGCRRAEGPPPTTRPDWRGAAIEGIAPLMSPHEVEAALNKGGYRQVPCASTKGVYADPLYRGADMPCYASPTDPVKITLYFLELHEGRRLAVAFFSQTPSLDKPEAERIAISEAYAQRLRARFGPPSIVTNNPSFRIVYWKRPGGRPSLPDMISTTIDAYSGANATLTSMWAYGEEREAK